MPQTALFCIDIQHHLALDPTTLIPHAPRVLAASTAILAHARTRIDAARASGETPDLEIIVVQHDETPEKGPLQKGSEAWEVVFPPREGDECERLVGKDVRDTFASNPDLANELRARGVDTVVAFGIQSECCVLETCRAALREGFRVVMLRGAHGTYDTEGMKAEELERVVEDKLAAEGAEISGWENWSEGR